MADNVAITAGSGTTVAADDISSVYYQRVKISWGVDGAAVDASASNPFPCTLTNLEFAEDAAHTTGDKGVMALAVRQDTPGTALAGTTGDYIPLVTDSRGGLFISGVFAEDVAHTTADLGHFVLGVRNDALAALGGTDGDYVPFQMNASGALFCDLSAVSVGAGDLAKAEDAAHTTGDVGVMALAVRNDALAALAGTDGDYAPLQVDANGALFCINTAIELAEDDAHQSGDKGVMALAVRNDDLAALAGTDGDYAPLQVDANGALYVNMARDAAKISTYTASVTATGTNDSGANQIFSITAGNLDGTNAHYLKVYDKGSAASEADTPILKIHLAANDTKHITFEGGLEIASGISLRATTEGVDSGTTAASANDVWATVVTQD